MARRTAPARKSAAVEGWVTRPWNAKPRHPAKRRAARASGPDQNGLRMPSGAPGRGRAGGWPLALPPGSAPFGGGRRADEEPARDEPGGGPGLDAELAADGPGAAEPSAVALEDVVPSGAVVPVGSAALAEVEGGAARKGPTDGAAVDVEAGAALANASGVAERPRSPNGRTTRRAPTTPTSAKPAPSAT